jgi:hypothetical protein
VTLCKIKLTGLVINISYFFHRLILNNSTFEIPKEPEISYQNVPFYILYSCDILRKQTLYVSHKYGRF